MEARLARSYFQLFFLDCTFSEEGSWYISTTCLAKLQRLAGLLNTANQELKFIQYPLSLLYLLFFSYIWFTKYIRYFWGYRFIISRGWYGHIGFVPNGAQSSVGPWSYGNFNFRRSGNFALFEHLQWEQIAFPLNMNSNFKNIYSYCEWKLVNLYNILEGNFVF